METWDIIISALLVLALLYYYFTSTFNFWKDRGVKGPKPIPIYGNFKDVIFNKVFRGDFTKKLYEQFKDEPMVGMFYHRTPILLLRDLDLIKDVLIKDFPKFANRDNLVYDKTEPLSVNLFKVEPARWRPLRAKLSPVFTSGKLKDMFYLLQECADNFGNFLDKLVEKNCVIECRNITAKYTTDVIGSCVFGLNMNSLTEEESDFRKMGDKIHEPSLWNTVRRRMRESLPKLYEIFWPIFKNREQTNFFMKCIKDTMEFREKNKVVRHDFIDLLMEIKKNQKVGDIEMTDTLLTAQAFVFFGAGFETSSTTMSNALYELALNQSIQDKLRQEVLEAYDKNGGVLTYASIKEMQYMDQVFRETLRMYPPLAVLTRESSEPYTFRGTKVTIPAKIMIWIPAYAIQRDSNIYPNPDVFDPTRFADDLHKTRHQMSYLPFGDGPRNCIGIRFANYQTKLGLAEILRRQKVETCKETMKSYVNHPASSVLLMPQNGIKLKFTKLKKES